MNKELISVCVPTYNGSEYLHECVNSILAQTFKNFELLIVDDQSSDSTLEIAYEYKKKDSRIKIFQNKVNLGLVGNWNRCLELAQGEWIKFVFQDDLIDPNCLKKMLEASHHGVPIICCRRRFIYEKNVPTSLKRLYLSLSDLKEIFPDKECISSREYCRAIGTHFYNFVGEPTSVMFHRSLVHKYGLFNPDLIQICDFEYWTRIAIHTGIVALSSTLASFRVHGKSATIRNRNRYTYHSQILDKLILLHNFLFHPNYIPLQKFNKLQTQNLTDELHYIAFKARFIANRIFFPNHHLLKEWFYIKKKYPMLGTIPVPSFFLILKIIAKKITKKINKKQTKKI